MRRLVVTMLTFVLTGCASGGHVTETTAPDGTLMKNTKCSKDAMACFSTAAESCKGSGGTYRVIASHSNSGGVLADILPGPVTWYNMTYVCGPSDGKIPDFPLKGSVPVMPPPPVYNKPVQTNCTKFGNNVNCTSY